MASDFIESTQVEDELICASCGSAQACARWGEQMRSSFSSESFNLSSRRPDCRLVAGWGLLQLLRALVDDNYWSRRKRTFLFHSGIGNTHTQTNGRALCIILLSRLPKRKYVFIRGEMTRPFAFKSLMATCWWQIVGLPPWNCAMRINAAVLQFRTDKVCNQPQIRFEIRQLAKVIPLLYESCRDVREMQKCWYWFKWGFVRWDKK